MTITNGGNLGLFENAADGEAHGSAMRAFLRGMDFFGEPVVKAVGTNTPPASPANGDAYIVGTSPTGAWAGKASNIARYSTIAAGWEFFTPKANWWVANQGDGFDYYYTGSDWAVFAKADSLLAHLAGIETMTALKTFTVGVSIGSASGGNLKPNSVRGLQLSGLVGSSYDLSLLNPAESAYYMRVPTGTAIPVFPQGIALSDTNWHITKDATSGVLLRGATGALYDLSLLNPGVTAAYMRVPTGTNTPSFPNGINLGGTVNLTAYDEGTWTPTAKNLGGTGITYSTKWVKVGNRVDITITASGTNITSTVESTTLTIPFTPSRISTGSVVANGSQYAAGACLATETGTLKLPNISSCTGFSATVTIFLN